MGSITKKTFTSAVFTIAICLSFYGIGCRIFNKKNELPVYNPADLNPELVANDLQDVSWNHKVADFNLINQDGTVITQADYKDKIYVTDFIFTRCPSICPVMTNNMEKLQAAFLQEDRVKLLSVSVTPEMDSVPILSLYAAQIGAVPAKWNITTGDKSHIYALARNSYFVASDVGDGGLQDFIHTPNFVLVDTQKQIRGIYDGTKEDEIQRLIADIAVLLQE